MNSPIRRWFMTSSTSRRTISTSNLLTSPHCRHPDLNVSRYQFSSQEGKQEKKVEKQVLLDERDFLWPKLRHMHIADCISRVIDDFNRFLKTNKAVSLNREENRKVTTLKVNHCCYVAVARLIKVLSAGNVQ